MMPRFGMDRLEDHTINFIGNFFFVSFSSLGWLYVFVGHQPKGWDFHFPTVVVSM